MGRIIGIMGAMPEEIDNILDLMSDRNTKTFGSRNYTSGTINNIQVVVAFSRWGKVAAASTASALVHEFGITELYFTGVAGALHPDLNIGDVVIAKRLIQHDMDARPLMPQFEIPLLSKTYFESNIRQNEALKNAVEKMFSNPDAIIEGEKHFTAAKPKLIIGDIASGDKFFADTMHKNALRKLLPDVVCVEMEGAAVAQVCYEYGIPFSVVRTISDTADSTSLVDFPMFIKNVAGKYSLGIIQNLFYSY